MEACVRYSLYPLTAALLAVLVIPTFDCALAQLAIVPPASSQRLSHVSATAEVGLIEGQLARMEPLIADAIAAGKMPGCVVCVGRQGKIAWLKAYGNKRLEPTAETMTTDTLFDLASITKPVATATSIMKLVEQGQLRLAQRVAEFFPDFGQHGKEEITVRHLLIHQSGLIPDNPLSDYEQGPDVAWQKICELKLVAPVGEQFKYSDVNFVVLAKLVELLSGRNVHEFSQDEIFARLGMSETGYAPSGSLRARAAPTEQRAGHWIQGEVHDPRAHLLDGIAGHAGLFSTAEDLAIYAQMMLNEGCLPTSDQPSQRILSAATVRAMTAAYPVSSGVRGLGWDKQTGYSSNKGDLLSQAAFGHGGFTGTVLWIDPEHDLFYIFLSNRVHPHGKGSVNYLAGQIANVIVAAIDAKPTGAPASIPGSPSHGRSLTPTSVLTGLDVLQREDFQLLAGHRVGLITNHTGRNASGTSTALLLHRAEQVNLTALFSPEHGWAGTLDIAKVGETQDAATGLRVYSLYGETRRPTAEMLADVDVLVFDIQDIGTRFYTYISTMGEAMRAAAEHGKRFIVLDRPNPINGTDVTGPMLDAGLESFVGYHALPLRHGMTTGELAMMMNDELQLDLDLTVIGCEGWQREQFWDATGLTWINPSPNMRSLNQAILYPGIGLLETTNISVGRGTDTPFEIIGAPWLDGAALAAQLRSYQLPGVTFIPVEFTPASSKHAGTACSGINIAITDRQTFEPVACGLAIAATLRELHPADWETKHLNRLLGNQRLADGIATGLSLEQLLGQAATGMQEFQARRQRFLLY
jgi:uncharacterized protein YbbC (DUF1343 family)/CubicO group peptidase (beta-lactamase class C family)